MVVFPIIIPVVIITFVPSLTIGFPLRGSTTTEHSSNESGQNGYLPNPSQHWNSPIPQSGGIPQVFNFYNSNPIFIYKGCCHSCSVGMCPSHCEEYVESSPLESKDLSSLRSLEEPTTTETYRLYLPPKSTKIADHLSPALKALKLHLPTKDPIEPGKNNYPILKDDPPSSGILKSINQPTNPTTKVIQPSNSSFKPVNQPTNPTTKLVQPSTSTPKSVNQPTNPTTNPVQPSTSTPESVNQPINPTTEPTRPSTSTSKSVNQLTSPTIKSARPSTSKPKSVNQPTNPTTKEVQRSTSTSKSVSRPTNQNQPEPITGDKNIISKSTSTMPSIDDDNVVYDSTPAEPNTLS